MGPLLGLFAVILPASATADAEVALRTASCADVVVIDIHGSGLAAYEPSPPGKGLEAKLQQLLTNKEVELETVPFKASGGFITLSKAALKLPQGYHESVFRTKNWLRKRLKQLAKTCKNTKVVLTGHSQGAQVAGDVFQERSWEQVVGTALFGDPYYNHTDTSNRFGLNVKPGQRIKTKLSGALSAPSARSAFNSSNVLSFCHQFDPVCQAPLSYKELAHFRLAQHSNYTEFGEPRAAAVYFAKLFLAKGDRITTRPSPPNKWPTKRHDGPPALYIYLGASFISPGWVSCSAGICIVGSGTSVHVFTLRNGIDQIATFPLSNNPQATLRSLGIQSAVIDELLRE